MDEIDGDKLGGGKDGEDDDNLVGLAVGALVGLAVGASVGGRMAGKNPATLERLSLNCWAQLCLEVPIIWSLYSW